jgi:hypothetical protein
MSPTLTPPESRDCKSIEDLLAWHANGTLGAADRAVVDAHVDGCTACRATLALERRIVETMRAPRDNVEQSPHAGWQKLVTQLDAYELGTSPAEENVRDTRITQGSAATAVESASNGHARNSRRRVNWPAALGAAVAVQAAAIAVLTVALVRHRQTEQARYHTLSPGDPTLAERGRLVRIAFDSTIDSDAARSIAAAATGRIVSGPSPQNVYTFVFPDSVDAGTLDQKVSSLRRHAHVLLAEPVILVEQSHTE